MDIDNGSSENSENNSTDLEQSLLQQFSCLGTSDKEELVQQLQKLLGNHLNDSTAAFFLDMNNWNLQAAICSYLDIESPLRLPSMTLVSDPKVNECENIEPNTCFQKSWNLLNNGYDSWPLGCYAQCSDGNNLSGQKMPVPSLRPGEGFILVIQMRSPDNSGIYQSKWRLCTSKGAYFGDPMWVIITVVEENTMAITEQLSNFNELGSPPRSTQNNSNNNTTTNNNVSNNPFIPQRFFSENVQNDGLPDETML